MRRTWGWSPWPLVSWITAGRAGLSAVEALSLLASLEFVNGVGLQWPWVVGYGLDWSIGLATVTKSHKNLNSLGHIGVCFPNV